LPSARTISNSSKEKAKAKKNKQKQEAFQIPGPHSWEKYKLTALVLPTVIEHDLRHDPGDVAAVGGYTLQLHPTRAVVEGCSSAGGGVAGHSAAARVGVVVESLDTVFGAAIPPARHGGRDRVVSER